MTMTHSMREREKISQCCQCSEYLCHIGFVMTFTKISTLFKRDRTSVAHACRKVEAMRDCSDKDLALEILEAAFVEFASSLELLRR